MRTDPGVHAQIRLTLFQALDAEPSALVRKILVASIAAAAGNAEEPWPELVPNAFALAKSASGTHQEASLRLLAELMSTGHGKAVLAQQAELGALVQQSLANPALQAAALALVSEMVSTLDKAGLATLQPALPMLESALKSLADAKDGSAFEDALQSLVACALEQPDFFKPRYKEWTEMMLQLAGAKGAVEDGNRALAFEWISTVAESKAKGLSKAVPGLPAKVLATAFAFMAEVEEDEAWTAVDEDEGDDDDEGLCKLGEAKVDFFVKQLGFGQTGNPLLELLQQYANSGRWEGKFAAAMACRAAVEFVDSGAALDVMATILAQLAQDGHMRVRYAALLALGQICHDQEAEFHARWHARLIPLLVGASADPVGRVSCMAIGALEAIIADLDDAVLSDYAPQIVVALVGRLTDSSHKGVLVATMEALGALAAGLEGSFDAHYDQLMAMLLAFVSRQDSSAETSKLRGKAFECISLLGYAVGKERFAAAAQQSMSAMLATPQVGDDVQTECIRDAIDRVCKVLGSDFLPFLPSLLPGIFASMKLDDAISTSAEDEDVADDEIALPTEQGIVKVKTAQMQEILGVVGLLTTFVHETGPGFLEYVRPTAEALSRILACADPVLSLASSIRDAVYPCWAELVAAVAKAVPAKGPEAQAMAMELVQTFVSKVAADVAKAEDPDDLAPMAHGIAAVVRNAGAGCLQPAQCQAVCDLAIGEIQKSFQREKALVDANLGLQAVGGTVPPGPADEEDGEDEGAEGAGSEKGEEDEEQECRVGLCAIFGACMKANPEVFVSHSWPVLQAMLQEWLGPNGDILGLHLASELCEHLGERAEPIWPVFMEKVISAICVEGSADARHISAFTVLLAAQVPSFGAQHGAAAYAALAQNLQKFKAKKSDEEAQRATDNAVAALVQLCMSHPGSSPDLDGCWQAALARMPLKVDLEEAQKMHRKLFVEVQKMSAGSLGNMTRVARVLGYLCEVYGRSEQMDDELQKDLSLAFAGLPQDILASLVGQFTPKQQKKAEKILQDGRSHS